MARAGRRKALARRGRADAFQGTQRSQRRFSFVAGGYDPAGRHKKKGVVTMNTVDCIKTRRSVRKFTEEKVPHEVLEQLVELSRWAPSWKNTQIARYVAVEDEALKSRIAEEATIPWNEGIIKGAPVLMVMTYVEKRSGFERDGSFSTTKGDRWQNFDCGVAAATFGLAAHELGLGSVVLGIFDEKKLAELLELPEGMGVACLMPLGYPAEEPAAPKRKEVADLLSVK